METTTISDSTCYKGGISTFFYTFLPIPDFFVTVAVLAPILYQRMDQESVNSKQQLSCHG